MVLISIHRSFHFKTANLIFDRVHVHVWTKFIYKLQRSSILLALFESNRLLECLRMKHVHVGYSNLSPDMKTLVPISSAWKTWSFCPHTRELMMMDTPTGPESELRIC